MSIICTDVEDSLLARKAAYKSTNKFIHASINPSCATNLPFPKDYKFAPCFMPKKFESMANRVHNFAVRGDDIWVVSFPKSGTTWALNIVWQLKNNLDLAASPVNAYVPFLEVAALYDKAENEKTRIAISLLDSTISQLDHDPSPRIIKSHLPVHLLPKQLWTVRPKIVYVARNPKDVAISMFHMIRNIGARYSRPLEDFLEIFLNDYVFYAPVHDHALDFWQIRSLDHVLFITYEEMSTDRFSAVKRISEFLQCKYSDHHLMQLTEYVSFSKLREATAEPTETIFGDKKADDGYRMLRKGKVAGFRDEMSAEFIRKFDEWTTERLKNSDFKYAV